MSASAQRSTSSEFVARSADSFAFEEFWRGLRRGALVPDRHDFNPARAIRFLKDIVLMEGAPTESSALHVRLVGSAIDMRLGESIAGHDYLEFVPRELHRGVLETVRHMHEQPCGLWQVMTVQYEKRMAQPAEVTAFPLKSARNPLVISLLKFAGKPVSPADVLGKTMVVETATQYEFIDIGAGLPHYVG